MTGKEYADRIARYLVRNYERRGLLVYREVSLGKTILGKDRRVDIFCLHEERERVMAVECKYQGKSGTVDEKIPYALADLKAMHIPAFLVYAGDGFSKGVLHMLQADAAAAFCLPKEGLRRSARTLELDQLVAMTFGWWDKVLRDKEPFAL